MFISCELRQLTKLGMLVYDTMRSVRETAPGINLLTYNTHRLGSMIIYKIISKSQILSVDLKHLRSVVAQWLVLSQHFAE